MGRMTPKECLIVVVFACSIIMTALAVLEFANGGGRALDYAEMALTTAVLSRVI